MRPGTRWSAGSRSIRCCKDRVPIAVLRSALDLHHNPRTRRLRAPRLFCRKPRPLPSEVMEHRTFWRTQRGACVRTIATCVLTQCAGRSDLRLMCFVRAALGDFYALVMHQCALLTQLMPLSDTIFLLAYHFRVALLQQPTRKVHKGYTKLTQIICRSQLELSKCRSGMRRAEPRTTEIRNSKARAGGTRGGHPGPLSKKTSGDVHDNYEANASGFCCNVDRNKWRASS